MTTTRTRIDHSTHAHPATPKARAACRTRRPGVIAAFKAPRAIVIGTPTLMLVRLAAGSRSRLRVLDVAQVSNGMGLMGLGLASSPLPTSRSFTRIEDDQPRILADAYDLEPAAYGHGLI